MRKFYKTITKLSFRKKSTGNLSDVCKYYIGLRKANVHECLPKTVRKNIVKRQKICQIKSILQKFPVSATILVA